MPVYRVRVLKVLGYSAPPIQRSEPALEQSRVASYVLASVVRSELCYLISRPTVPILVDHPLSNQSLLRSNEMETNTV